MTTENEAAVSRKPDLPRRRKSVNMLVGHNMAEYRSAAGITQEELGKRLGGWTKVAVSAAERSWDGKRVRQFSADDLVAIAAALGVPVVALLLPPSDADTAVEYTFTTGSEVGSSMDAASLLEYALSSYGKAESPVLKAFRERLIALGTRGLLEPLTDEVLQRARDEAVQLLQETRRVAAGVTGDARARAESLERDAIERHRQAMGSLVQEREELERRITDLRAFEREYRSRLTAYVEGQLRDLYAGATDDDALPAMGTRTAAVESGTPPRTRR